MLFCQTGFLSPGSANSHSTGWNGTFDRLAELLLNRSLNNESDIRGF
jgi:hypothetical protein